jgi:hypothetical protein
MSTLRGMAYGWKRRNPSWRRRKGCAADGQNRRLLSSVAAAFTSVACRLTYAWVTLGSNATCHIFAPNTCEKALRYQCTTQRCQVARPPAEITRRQPRRDRDRHRKLITRAPASPSCLGCLTNATSSRHCPCRPRSCREFLNVKKEVYWRPLAQCVGRRLCIS